MKRISAIYLFISCLLTASCGDNFLDKPPYGILTDDNYYKTEGDAFTALTAIYSYFGGEEGGGILEVLGYEFADIASDDCIKGGESDNDRPFVNDLAFYRALSNNQNIEQWWMYIYRGIFRCNALLDRLPGIEFRNNALKKRYEAETRFIRAYFYLKLVRIYGGTPLVDKVLIYPNDNIMMPRNSREEVHTFIINELKACIPVLPPKSEMNLAAEWGRASKGAALSLLARTELYFGNYTEARKAAKEVIESGEYSLEPQFGNLFFKNDYISNESIFEVLHQKTDGNGDETILPTYYRSRGSGGWGFLCPTQDLVDEFEIGDPRLLYTITQTGDRFPKKDGTIEIQNHTGYTCYSGYHARKLFYPETRRADRNRMDTNQKKIRYADILLIYAEALLEDGGDLNEVCNYINRVRERARNTYKWDPEAYGDTPEEKKASRMLKIPEDVDIPDVKPASGREHVRKALRHERRVELATESQRLYDLRRWGADYMKERIETAKHFTIPGDYRLRLPVFPIPQTEIDRLQGLIKQNEGW
ncbi:MAG: RagB/SusD family nutrient uptake outer membrane protein [Tannerellaceae bacterium]|jgi:tetratricopeptide (TPR) repeat protein|nr:RagB/SusD family nutrient uptake outer membrane protein [Tannerellaceae bacterium]